MVTGVFRFPARYLAFIFIDLWGSEFPIFRFLCSSIFIESRVGFCSARHPKRNYSRSELQPTHDLLNFETKRETYRGELLERKIALRRVRRRRLRGLPDDSTLHRGQPRMAVLENNSWDELAKVRFDARLKMSASKNDRGRGGAGR